MHLLRGKVSDRDHACNSSYSETNYKLECIREYGHRIAPHILRWIYKQCEEEYSPSFENQWRNGLKSPSINLIRML